MKILLVYVSVGYGWEAAGSVEDSGQSHKIQQAQSTRSYPTQPLNLPVLVTLSSSQAFSPDRGFTSAFVVWFAKKLCLAAKLDEGNTICFSCLPSFSLRLRMRLAEGLFLQPNGWAGEECWTLLPCFWHLKVLSSQLTKSGLGLGEKCFKHCEKGAFDSPWPQIHFVVKN